MDFRVGRVFELLRHPAVRGVLENFLRLANGALHALRTGRKHEIGTEHGQQSAALEAHRFRHGQNQFVSLGRRDEGEGNARVAAGRFDNNHALFQKALGFGVLNHCHADAILDAAERVKEFAFDRHGCTRAFADAVELDQRRAADGFDDVIVKLAHRLRPMKRDCLKSNGRQGNAGVGPQRARRKTWATRTEGSSAT